MILISKPGEWESRRGHYLGEMTDELSDTNGANSIQTFVLVLDLKIMPLNLLVQIKKVIQLKCVVKGNNLNYKNTLDINYDTLKDIVTGEKKEYNMQR
jgi:hypothetical protein